MIPNATFRRARRFAVIALAGVTILLGCATTLELGTRLVFAFRVGPSVLFRGAGDQHLSLTRSELSQTRTVVQHQNHQANFSKYFPNQIRYDIDPDTGERFRVSINSHGYRGADFSIRKPPGVIRIVALGASSTFGYFDRDDETYPVYLERELRRRLGPKVPIEVINLGIPHQAAWSIYSLFVTDGLPLDPDIVTFYEGNNDAMTFPAAHAWCPDFLQRIARHSMVGALIRYYLRAHSRQVYPRGTFDQTARRIAATFVDGVAKIRQECAQRGIQFIVANQQHTSTIYSRSQLAKITYAEETATERAKLENGMPLGDGEVYQLAHSVIMSQLQAWATATGVPFVDAIGRLDHHRDVLVSWVHLNPSGNRILADAFAEKIAPMIAELAAHRGRKPRRLAAARVGERRWHDP